MAIIISGASGDLGRRVTAQLLQNQKVEPSELIMLTRNPQSLADMSAQGVSVREASFDDDTATLANAMQGGHVLLLISTLSIGKRVQQHMNAIAAAKKAQVPHVVYTSSIGIQPQTPSISGKEHHATEQALRRSGLSYTILRNGWYADVIPMLMMKPAMQMGGFVASTGGGHIAPIAKDDCARAAAAVLANSASHVDAVYEITGPQLFTFEEIAQTCSEKAGVTIPYKDVSHDEKLAIFDAMGANREYEEGMMNDNTGAWASNEMITYEMAIKQHFFSILSHHVKLITGEDAMPLSKVIDQYREFWAD